jgi:hypothetical protein
MNVEAYFSSMFDINYSAIDLTNPLQNYVLNYDPEACKPWSFSPVGVNPDDQTLSFDCLTDILTISN